MPTPRRSKHETPGPLGSAVAYYWRVRRWLADRAAQGRAPIEGANGHDGIGAMDDDERKRRLPFDRTAQTASTRGTPGGAGASIPGRSGGGTTDPDPVGGDAGHYVPVGPGSHVNTDDVGDGVIDDGAGFDLPRYEFEGDIRNDLDPDGEPVIGHTDYPDPIGGGGSFGAPVGPGSGFDGGASATGTTTGPGTTAETVFGGGGTTFQLGGDEHSMPAVVPELIEDWFKQPVWRDRWYVYRGTWTTDNGFLDALSLGSGWPEGLLRYIGRDFTDVRLTGTLRIDKGANPTYHLLARWNFDDSAFSGYTTSINAGGQVQLVRVDAGSATSLGSFAVGSPVAGDTLSLRCEGTTIEASFNGTPVITVSDATYTSGYVGIGARNPAGVDFQPWSAQEL